MINKTAIIIVTYNGSKWIKKCLASVFETKHENFEVIVVDNSSDDNSADIVRNFVGDYGQRPELIRLDENIGFAGGNNVGIQYALGRGCDAVVLLNQDTEVEPGWLNNLVDASNPNDVGVAQAMMLLGDERHLVNNAGNAMHYLGFGFVKHYRESAESWINQKPLEIGYASGAAMLIKREVLEKLSWSVRRKDGFSLRNQYSQVFDEKFFMYHEDLDLCWRARLLGYKIALAPESIVYHYYEFNRNKKIFYWTERNRWCVLLQNYQIGTLLMLAPMLFVIELMMILYSVAFGWFLYKLKSYAWILSRMKDILSKRSEVQKMRRIDDKRITKYMDSELSFSQINNPALKYIISPALNIYFKIISI